MNAIRVQDVFVPEVDWGALPKNSAGFQEWIRTWSDYHHDARILAHMAHQLQQEEGFEWAGMIVIPRGAFVTGLVVARELGIRDYLDTLCIRSYDDRMQQGELVVTKPISPGFLEGLKLGPSRRLFLGDDLVDQGSTMERARRELGEYLRWSVSGAIYAKPNGRHTLNLVAREVPQDVWIRQPFDTAFQPSEPISGPDGR